MIIDHIKKVFYLPAKDADSVKDIIRYEAKLGGDLFGPVARGSRREFFWLDSNTWVWHEEWKDESGIKHQVTTRYLVYDNGIYKAQSNSERLMLSDGELMNFYQAVKLYGTKVVSSLEQLSARQS